MKSVCCKQAIEFTGYKSLLFWVFKHWHTTILDKLAPHGENYCFLIILLAALWSHIVPKATSGGALDNKIPINGWYWYPMRIFFFKLSKNHFWQYCQQFNSKLFQLTAVVSFNCFLLVLGNDFMTWEEKDLGYFCS